ncbi:MAG: hypothetical protein K6A98_05960 [Prevotella sp.]|nr:hypothetical protein [Prevotella sp.]
MITKNIKRLLIAGLVCCGFAAVLTSCSDDDNVGESPRFFRPVPSYDTNRNILTVNWNAIAGATEYVLTLSRQVTDENGETQLEMLRQVTTPENKYIFNDLAWDEKYVYTISCNNGVKTSEDYESDPITIAYSTKLTEVKTIDNAARVAWKNDANDDVFAILAAIPANGGEAVYHEVTEDEMAQGFADIYGLNPETQYLFTAYKDLETHNNDTYAGRLKGTTKASVDFDEKYGVGMWIDLRDETTNTIFQGEAGPVWDDLGIKDGMTIILRGEMKYKVNATTLFDRSLHFVTGQTLGGNAQFISSGGFLLEKGSTVDELSFQDIDFISDKAGENPMQYVKGYNAKDFGGRQVYNSNGMNSTLKSLIFKGCTFTGYRAVVRAQGETDNINDIVFDGCVFNGIGDQGIVTNNNKGTDMRSITFKDCTFLNVVMATDVRSTTDDKCNVSAQQCSFCYCPIEGSTSGLFRFGDLNVTFSVSNCIFGPSLSCPDNKTVTTFTPGGTKEDVLSYQMNKNFGTVAVDGTYFTSFPTWNTSESKYFADQATILPEKETDIWQNPADGDLKLVGATGLQLAGWGAGASKWR